MEWYIVVKTIKGIPYRYRQRTWRDDEGRVRTESKYIGRATDETPPAVVFTGAIEPVVSDVFATEPAVAALVTRLLDPATAAPTGMPPVRSWSEMRKLKSPRAFELHAGIHSLPQKLGLTVTTRPALPERASQRRPATFDGSYFIFQRRRVQIMAPERFKSTPHETADQAYHHTFLHELAHATKLTHLLNRQPIGDTARAHYAHEEQIVELASLLVLARLDLAPATPSRSAHYLQHWRQVSGQMPLETLLRDADRIARFLQSQL